MPEALTIKQYLHLRKKTAWWGSDLGLQRDGRQFPWRWKHLVNKYLLGLQREWDPGISTDFAGFLSVYTAGSHYSCLWCGSLLGIGSLGTLFRQLERMSKFLPESFEPAWFSARCYLHAKETFWVGRFCSPKTLTRSFFFPFCPLFIL